MIHFDDSQSISDIDDIIVKNKLELDCAIKMNNGHENEVYGIIPDLLQ